MRAPHWAVTVASMYVVLIPAALWSSAHAKADPGYAFANASSVCAVLDHDPNVAGVVKVVDQLTTNGLTLNQISEVFVLSIENVCPKHQGWFMALAEKYSKPTVPVSGGIGGVLR